MLPGLTPEEARDLTVSVGTHQRKRRLSPVEVAEQFQKAIRAGSSLVDCARFVNLTGPSMVSRFLRLLKLSPAIRHNVDWGQSGATLSFATAWRLAELGEDEQKLSAAQILSNGLRNPEVAQALQLKERSHRPLLECITEVIRMRPSITRKHVFLGAVTQDSIKSYLARLKQNERDELLSGVLRELYGPLARTSARLGPDRFTIVTDELGADRLKQSTLPSFEIAINGALSKRTASE